MFCHSVRRMVLYEVPRTTGTSFTGGDDSDRAHKLCRSRNTQTKPESSDSMAARSMGNKRDGYPHDNSAGLLGVTVAKPYALAGRDSPASRYCRTREENRRAEVFGEISPAM